MFSALYYPHTELPSKGLASLRLLKRALLMWDHLEFIVPFPRFRANYQDRVVAEAIELIGRNRCPNDDEKREAHSRIEEFVTRPHLPDVFYYVGSEPYEIYPQKFLPDTWKLLTKLKLAGPLLLNEDYPVSRQAGLAVMAILADCCAGVTRNRVTDRTQAYATLAGLLADNPKERLRDNIIDANLRARPPKESLISLRLSLPDIDSLSLNQLIQFRQREFLEKGSDWRKMRHNFVRRIEEQVKELTTNDNLTKSDLEELQDRFFQQNLDDLRGLKEGLGFELREVAVPVAITVVAGATTAFAALYPGASLALKGVISAAGAPLTIGGAISTANKFFKARAGLLRNHPLALLHELRGRGRRVCSNV